MARQVSIGAMIEQIDGLRDTDALNDWEQGFATSIVNRYVQANKDTRGFSEAQVLKIEAIWERHFA